MAFCRSCGTKLPDGAAFCASCGAGVAGRVVAPAPVSEPVAPVPAPVAAAPAPAAPYQAPAPVSAPVAPVPAPVAVAPAAPYQAPAPVTPYQPPVPGGALGGSAAAGMPDWATGLAADPEVRTLLIGAAVVIGAALVLTLVGHGFPPAAEGVSLSNLLEGM